MTGSVCEDDVSTNLFTILRKLPEKIRSFEGACCNRPAGRYSQVLKLICEGPGGIGYSDCAGGCGRKNSYCRKRTSICQGDGALPIASIAWEVLGSTVTSEAF